MGYMGFGMRKETYSQKPRRPFGALKSYLSTTLPSPKGAAPNDVQTHANGPKKFFGSSVSNYFARPTFRSLMALAISTLLAGLILWVVIKLTYVALDPHNIVPF